MTPGSALYAGTVFHRRLEPVEHELSYPVRMPLLDLRELPEALDAHPLWSARRPAPFRFRAADFLRTEGEPPASGPEELADRAWELAEPDVPPGRRGTVRVLAFPRALGVGFNPVSFLFLCDPCGAARAAIAEVTNTPWGERHTYIVRRRGEDGPMRAVVPKRMHVSPFNGMDQSYELNLTEPGETATITVTNRERGRIVFEAGLSMRRLPLTRAELNRTIAQQPLGPIGALGRIYGHALRLRLKGAPFHPHPASSSKHPELA